MMSLDNDSKTLFDANNDRIKALHNFQKTSPQSRSKRTRAAVCKFLPDIKQEPELSAETRAKSWTKSGFSMNDLLSDGKEPKMGYSMLNMKEI